MKAKNKHKGLRVLRQRESRNSSWFTTIQKFTLLIPNFRIYLRCIRDEIYWAVLKRLLSFIFLRFSNEKLSCATFSTNQRKKDFILSCSKDFSRARSRLSRFTMFTDCFLDWRITHAYNDTGSGCAVPSSQCIVGLLKQLECLICLIEWRGEEEWRRRRRKRRRSGGGGGGRGGVEKRGLIPEQRLLIESTLKSDTVQLTAVSFCSSTWISTNISGSSAFKIAK